MDISSLNGITQDSREVKDGFLFAAFKGEKSDGRDHIAAAIKSGASHILTHEGTQQTDGAVFITDPNPRKIFAHLVAQFYPAQPQTIMAVTGTNGKTSVVHFIEQIWKTLGYKAASIGTLQGGMTTSDPVTLHKTLTKLSEQGITHLAMEASSHGLHQYRLDGANIAAAGFTNLSHDHLDYHKDMKEYLRAKSRLFTEVIDQNGTAVINADTKEYAVLESQITSPIISYGEHGEHLQILAIKPTADGQQCKFKIFDQEYDLNISLVGHFQILNALCALGLVISQYGVDHQKAIHALEQLKGARGRLEFVSGHSSGAGIYVDYAHTPDALETVLKALRAHTNGKLLCVLGCGGDRDTAKRTEMGKIANDLADTAIVTDDNPRSEDPAAIRAAILSAAPNATEIANRRDAIHHAVQNLAAGDILLVAGKGHEQGQIFATHTDPFDDVKEVKTAIQALKI